MNTTEESELPAGTTPYFAGVHKWLERGLLICLTALVIEGTFTFPLVAVWYGWPTLSLQEICAEFARVRFNDDTRTCEFPYPLLGPSEGSGQKTAVDSWGIQPTPGLKPIAFREFVRRKEARDAARASKATEDVPQ